MEHILSVKQFDADFLYQIFMDADRYSRDPNKYKDGDGKVLANLFYEPSTRTSSSFYSAMVRLGGEVIPINEVNYSSVSKGENLEDTIRTMGCYADVIVLRHPENGAAEKAAAVSPVPIINAGDGTGEHPTQALLDMYTIFRERQKRFDGYLANTPRHDLQVFNGMTVTMMGDLKHGRTVHSLCKLLRLYDVKINFVAPYDIQMPQEYVLEGDGVHLDLDEVISTTDVLYVTRAQKERHNGAEFNSYALTQEHMNKAHAGMIVMHPLPRVDEIPAELDSDPRTVYFEQMKHGLYARMALLKHVFK